MKVEDINSREVYATLFGIPLMTMMIVLVGFFSGYYITTKSNVPTSVIVSPAQPTVEVKVPQPNVSVNVPVPSVTVHVPKQETPDIHVNVPPPLVQNQFNRAEATELIEKIISEKPKPAVAPTKVDSKRIEEPAALPVKVDKSSGMVTPPPAPREMSFDDLYASAETFITNHCKRNSLDAAAESKRWLKVWNDGLSSSGAESEQAYINNYVINHRSMFNVETATPDQLVEACRILLRYRDGNMEVLHAMKETLSTQENLRKALTILAANR